MSKAESVGDRIAQARREKAVRERRDIRPVDMARAVGVSGATVSDWESSKVTPRDDAMLRIAEFLGVTPAYLRYGVVETTTPSVGEGDIPPGHTLTDRDEAARQAAIDRAALEKRKRRRAGGQ